MNNSYKMAHSEAPSDRDNIAGKQIWGYTINIAPNKLFFNSGISWNKLGAANQTTYLEVLIRDLLTDCGYETEYKFEFTKSQNVHVHGIIYGMDYDTVRKFQERVHTRCGFSQAPPNRVCFIEKTKISAKFWLQYMAKNQ